LEALRVLKSSDKIKTELELEPGRYQGQFAFVGEGIQ
jgi:hypothetical protein